MPLPELRQCDLGMAIGHQLMDLSMRQSAHGFDTFNAVIDQCIESRSCEAESAEWSHQGFHVRVVLTAICGSIFMPTSAALKPGKRFS